MFRAGVEARTTAGLESGATSYPTLPSRLTPSSFCASTANSMGSSLKTVLQNPFTIIETAFSAVSPRWRR